MSGEPMWKIGRTALKHERQATRRKRAKKEKDAKAETRKRDKRCRFPRCGCQKLGVAIKAFPEVSHSRHKGMGGNPSGDRSTTAELLLLCKHRHQDGAISRHKGTLRAIPLTPIGYDGPIAWQVDVNRLREDFSAHPQDWREVAREDAGRQLLPLTPEQIEILDTLAEMEL